MNLQVFPCISMRFLSHMLHVWNICLHLSLKLCGFLPEKVLAQSGFLVVSLRTFSEGLGMAIGQDPHHSSTVGCIIKGRKSVSQSLEGGRLPDIFKVQGNQVILV